MLLVGTVLAATFWAADGDARGACAGLGVVRAFDVGGDLADTGVPFVSGSGLGDAGTGGISGTSFGSEVPFVVAVVSGGTGGDSAFTGSGSGCAGCAGFSGCIGCITGDLKRNEVGGSDGTLAASTAGFGGHSRFSLSSSLAESPVIWETTLELLGEDAPVAG